jgi:glycine oxidase
MQTNSSVDYIIVGMGLAGSTMALQLIKAGKKIVVLDQPERNLCSRVAAGLFNPVTGNRMMKTWLADDLFPYLREFYTHAEKITEKKFFYPMPLYRPFISIAEQNEWMGRSAEKNFENIIENIYTDRAFQDVHNPFGGLLLKQCGYIDTVAYMNAVRILVEKNGVYKKAKFDYSRLEIGNQFVKYEDIIAPRIIFCEGHGVLENPWFRRAGVRGLKGEIIHIKSSWNKHVIINRGVYIVPSKIPSQFKVGSTYNLKDNSSDITLDAREELDQKMKDLVQYCYEITGQEWGIRPTTPDRRPILGEHPGFKPLLIFNGLGTKGVSLAPYFSNVLFQWSENAIPLRKEVDVTRYKLLY